jgi:SAM-dependent methyltransferase
MADRPPRDAWDWIYATREPTSVGWYEPDPVVSKSLVAAAVARGARSLVDVGGGFSSLVDHVLDLGLERVAVMDISEAGLAIAQHRLGARADAVTWIVGDVSTVDDIGRFDIWHDRAAFHFLLEPETRRRYVALAERTLAPGGTAIIATFADDGPERCSGLPVRRYDPPELAAELGSGFRLLDSHRHLHHTPAGVPQQFQYSTFERVLATVGDDATRPASVAA